eukprot:7159761-Prymnesium_polylepis.1
MKIDPSMTVQAVVDHVEATLLAPLGFEPTFTIAARKDNSRTSHWSWLVKSGDALINLNSALYERETWGQGESKDL